MRNKKFAYIHNVKWSDADTRFMHFTYDHTVYRLHVPTWSRCVQVFSDGMIVVRSDWSMTSKTLKDKAFIADEMKKAGLKMKDYVIERRLFRG